MFARLFAESGLSLDRLRALLAVGAAGGIVKAAAGDPVRQSQFSRQIKELEDFFQAKLVERQGKHLRLTSSGAELARLARFFLLGLSNFHRACRTGEQTFCLGASATFIQHRLVPLLADSPTLRRGARFAVEIATDEEIERRLHELTLAFGVVTCAALSRPLQLKPVGSWRLELWVPRALFESERAAAEALKRKRLPLALPASELPSAARAALKDYEPQLACTSFVEAREALRGGGLAAWLPDFLCAGEAAGNCLRVRVSAVDKLIFHYRLAWNPRVLRLNPHAGRQRDFLRSSLPARR